MKSFLFIALLFLGANAFAQKPVVKVADTCQKGFLYTADSSKCYYVYSDCDTDLIADYNACAYYYHSYTPYYLTETEKAYDLANDDHRKQPDYLIYNSYAVKRLLARCPQHKYIILDGDFTTVIEGTDTLLTTGTYKRYFKDTLVVKGRFVHGELSGFCTFYSYSLHPGKSTYYFGGTERVDAHSFMEHATPLYGIILAILALLAAAFAAYKGWYARYHVGIYYTLLSVNAFMNVFVSTRKVHDPIHHFPLSILFIPRMVYQFSFLHSLLSMFLLCSTAFYVIKPGNRTGLRVIGILLLIYNVVLALTIAYFNAHPSHFAFG